MNIKFWNQPKMATLENILNENLVKGFKKVSIIAGMAKDTGFEVIYDAIVEARNLGSEVNIYLGIDRKNISKDMLIKLLKLGCNLFVHINRDDNKVETRLYVFEDEEDKAYVYQSGGKFSEGGLINNFCVIQENIYEREDRKLFDNFISVLMHANEEVFKSVDEEDIRLLAEKGEIVARITERKIPSISELYGSSSIDAIANDVYDESSSMKLFEIPESDDFDIDVDVDFSVEGDIKSVELSVESEARKEKENKENIEKIASEKLAKFYEKDNEKSEPKKASIIKDVDNIDFSNINIFVFEANKIIEKGVGEGELRIPHYLYENMTDFFGKEFKNIVDDKGKEKLARSVVFDVLDVNSGMKKEDENVLMYDNGKAFAIKSKVLKEMNVLEADIIRLIKENDEKFEIELIKNGSKEYDIWESFCKYTMKNSKRKFGVM